MEAWGEAYCNVNYRHTFPTLFCAIIRRPETVRPGGAQHLSASFLTSLLAVTTNQSCKAEFLSVSSVWEACQKMISFLKTRFSLPQVTLLHIPGNWTRNFISLSRSMCSRNDIFTCAQTEAIMSGLQISPCTKKVKVVMSRNVFSSPIGPHNVNVSTYNPDVSIDICKRVCISRTEENIFPSLGRIRMKNW